MKHPADTKFAKWLENNRYSDPAFAAKMMELDPDRHYAVKTVENWRRGRAMPRKRALTHISTITNGEITADAFMEPNL